MAPKWARFAEARNVRAGGADPPRGRRLPVFMRMGAHRAHELLSPKPTYPTSMPLPVPALRPEPEARSDGELSNLGERDAQPGQCDDHQERHQSISFNPRRVPDHSDQQDGRNAERENGAPERQHPVTPTSVSSFFTDRRVVPNFRSLVISFHESCLHGRNDGTTTSGKHKEKTQDFIRTCYLGFEVE